MVFIVISIFNCIKTCTLTVAILELRNVLLVSIYSGVSSHPNCKVMSFVFLFFLIITSICLPIVRVRNNNTFAITFRLDSTVST